MTTPLGRDFEFELDDVVFGCGTTVEVTEWDPGTAETRAQDQDEPFGDARHFGRDQKTPPTWAFTLTIKEPDHAAALATLERLQAAWDLEALRRTPGQVVPLRYRVGDRSRLVHGRPRRFTPVLRNMLFGRLPVVCDFALSEGVYYADSGNSVPVPLTQPDLYGGGFTFPITFPQQSAIDPNPSTTQLHVGGTRPTWAEVAIDAPVGMANPWIEIDGRVWSLKGGIPAGMSVTMAGHPWRRYLLRSDGAYVSSMLDPRSRLAALRLDPGVHHARFGGFDNTGSASAVVTFHDAYRAL